MWKFVSWLLCVWQQCQNVWLRVRPYWWGIIALLWREKKKKHIFETLKRCIWNFSWFLCFAVVQRFGNSRKKTPEITAQNAQSNERKRGRLFSGYETGYTHHPTFKDVTIVISFQANWWLFCEVAWHFYCFLNLGNCQNPWLWSILVISSGYLDIFSRVCRSSEKHKFHFPCITSCFVGRS